MSDFWNKRYAENEFAYSEQPNEFFAAQLALLLTGSIILPCEGEGRNAVYAAKAGWKVEAFDYSREGMKKAEALMRQKGVTLNYSIYNVAEATYPENTFDVVALIYAHLPVVDRRLLHKKSISWLKPGGVILLEAFSPGQKNYSSGGPKDESMLYSEATIKDDFAQLNIQLLNLEKITLHEGKYHEGEAEVIRLVAQKRK